MHLGPSNAIRPGPSERIGPAQPSGAQPRSLQTGPSIVELRAPDPIVTPDQTLLAHRSATPADPCDVAAQLTGRTQTMKMLDKSGLLAAAGEPKSFRLFGLELFQLSKGYREVLEKTGAYHQCLAKTVDTGTAVGRLTAAMAMARLDELESSIDKYLAKGGHTRTAVMANLRTQLGQERETLRSLSTEIGQTADAGSHVKSRLADLMGFSREGIALHAAPRFLGGDVKEARKTLEAERRGVDPVIVQLLDKGFSAKETKLLTGAGLNLDAALSLRSHKVAVTPHSVEFMLRPDRQDGPMTPLGKGAINETAIVKVKGHANEFVFKPIKDKETGWVARQSGIDLEHPKTAERNLATCRIDEALGFNVVVGTKLGYGSPPPPPENAPPVLGMVMAKAKGVDGLSAARQGAFENPQLRQQLLRLQLLDHLTAQGDRHCNNYLVEKGADGNYSVRGIDNDQCLGKNMAHPADIAFEPDDEDQMGYRGTGLPPFIDSDSAKQLRAFTPARLRDILSADFSQEEVQAAVSRLQHLHAHIDELSRSGRIVSTERLSEPSVSRLFNFHNSYIGRELAIASRGP